MTTARASVISHTGYAPSAFEHAPIAAKKNDDAPYQSMPSAGRSARAGRGSGSSESGGADPDGRLCGSSSCALCREA
jgi:hypothetical protein